MKRVTYIVGCFLALCACQEEASAPVVAASEGELSAPASAPASGEGEGCPHHAPLAATPLPETSIFHLEHPFEDTRGASRRLSELRGRPSVWVMFYASCTTACPILFADGQRLEELLSPEVRAQVRFVYVTVDPARDTPQALGEYAERLGLDQARWWLLRGSEPHTRALAAVLGVQYRADGKGDFSHTSRLALVDGEGRVVGTVDGLKQPLEEAASTLTALVKAP